MSKTEADLLHFQNRVKQLDYLLSEEKEKNRELLKLIAEAKFAMRPWIKRLERL